MHGFSTFETQEPTLNNLLTKIKVGKIQLPDFQRGWVWDDNHIKSLLASITLAYPIGALMLLETGGDGVRFKPRPVEGVKNVLTADPEELILDGQQRLTSLYLSLISKEPVLTTTDKKEKIKRYYYLDMKKCLNPDIDRLEAIVSVPEDKKITSDFGRKVELDLSTRSLEFKNSMFPLNIIYDLPKYYEWINEYREYYNHSSEISAFSSKFEQEIFLVFQQYEVPVIRLTKETPKEAVCQVFENVNTGGVSLTVFELVTATFAAEDFQLRQDWEKRKALLYKYDVLRGIDESAFLTSITLLASYKRHINTGTAVGCKRKDVLKLTLEEYKENVDEIMDGYFKAAKLLMREHIFSRKDLPYQTQLIPLSAICAFLGSSFDEDYAKQKIIKWYWCGVLGEMYGGANETRYALDISGLINWLKGGNEPATVRDATFSPMRLLTLQTRLSAAYKGIMALMMKKGGNDFISGDQIEITNYFGDNVDIHHIFPRKYCIDMKYNKQKWNSIINKTPLSYRTNRILGGNRPSKYISIIEDKHKVTTDDLDKYLESHLIAPQLIREDNFHEFIRDRAIKILDIIEQAMGKKVQGRDSEEVVDVFGDILI